MPDFTSAEVFGAWLSIFLTLFILSFLYEDNPIYKVGEHLFLGVSIGYGVVEIYFGVFRPNLLDKLFGAPVLVGDAVAWTWSRVLPGGEPLFVGELTYERPFLLVPLIFAVLLLMKFSKKYGWLARIPVAFIVAAYAGVKLTGEVRAHLLTSVRTSIPDFRRLWAENLAEGKETVLRVWESGVGFVDTTVLGTCSDGDTWYAGWWCWTNDGAGVFSGLVLVIGLCACLLHFYFSAPHNRVMANVSRVGILVLMLSFGASFGYTVMGRISLAIGRAQEMRGDGLTPEELAAQNPQLATVVAFVCVVGFLVAWKVRGGGETPPGPTPATPAAE
jgi:hypothetical protein